jgi:HPr kinase/phosphorylase
MIRINKGIEINKIVDHNDLKIVKIYNKKWVTNKIKHPRAQKPGLAIAGYLKYLSRGRIQIFGKTEMGYLNQLDSDKREMQLKKFFSIKLPAIVISEKQPVDELIISIAMKYKTPILISNLNSSLLTSRISSLLYRHFSKKIKINGVLMDILGLGILIKGDSGIGKSETALELANKGYNLVADDLIEFYLNSNDEPVGMSIEKIKGWIEVRGLGIINVIDIFGAGAVLEEKKLDMVVNLERWSNKKKYDRLGEGNLYFQVLGKDIPMFDIPVAPGRDLSTLIEVAVKYFISRKNGNKSFMEHIYGKEEK